MNKMNLHYLIFSLLILSISGDPFIVTPTFFKAGESNIIRVFGSGSEKCVIMIGNERTDRCHKSFYPETLRSTIVQITVNGVEKFRKVIEVQPNIAKVHIHLDKPVYQVNESVNVRILPLTYSGEIYEKPFEAYLLNSKKYIETSTNRTIQVKDGSIISESFRIPSYTFYGDWEIVVKPKEMDSTRFVQHFRVLDYILPTFTITGQLYETTDVENVGFKIVAQYAHGKPVNGYVYVYCLPFVGQKTQLKSAKLTNGLWDGNANLTKCNSGDKILIEARESGSGMRKDFTLDWDLKKPRFEVTAVRPYFNSETEQIQILINGLGITKGSVTVNLNAMKGDLGKLDTTTLSATGNIGSVVTISLPKTWSENLKVIGVEAFRNIGNDKSDRVTLYLPNLKNSILSNTFFKPLDFKNYYTNGDVMNVQITRLEMSEQKFLVVCSQDVHWVEDDGKSTNLVINISRKMYGTCYLAALIVHNSNKKVFSDVMLFKVRLNCENCNVKVSKIDSSGVKRSVKTFEPRDNVELEFTGSPHSLVSYRAIDERLNHIENIQSSEDDEDQDYLFTFRNKSGINIFSEGDMRGISDQIVDSCCDKSSPLLLDTSKQKSKISEECLYYLNNPWKPDNFKVEYIHGASIFPSRAVARPPSSRTEIQNIHQMIDDVSIKQETKHDTRTFFPETWLFDTIRLPANGTGSVFAEVPDSITTWEVASYFWEKGQVSMFKPVEMHFFTKKTIFLEFDLPKHVYVNETISPMVTVTSSDSSESQSAQKGVLVLCLSKLPRQVCADQGIDGKKGTAYYNRVDFSSDEPIAKSVMMNFLTAGDFNVTITLNWNSCDTIPIDSVTRLVAVRKRPDTKEYIETHTIDTQKESSANMEKGTITFSDRKTSEENVIHTLISSHLEDSDTIYSFRVTISEFLQTERVTQGEEEVEKYSPKTLSTVIKQFASTVFDLKSISLDKNVDDPDLKQRVNSLENRLMSFSDCSSNGKPCGYNYFGPPKNSRSYSVLLTALATSLLCLSDAEKNRVNGSLQTLIKNIPKLNETIFREDLSDIIDVERFEDKKFIVISFLYQTLKDCSNYTSETRTAFAHLQKYYYQLDEENLTDRRVFASLASMSGRATSELMRGLLLARMDNSKPPFWNCNRSSTQNVNEETIYFNKRREESCQLLTNSLALSAVVNANTESGKYDWDGLAEWISDKQSGVGSFGNSINSVIVKRSLYEKKKRTLSQTSNKIQVTIKCDTCMERTMEVTDQAEEIHIPTNQRTVSLTVKGSGKVTVTARIVAAMRPRQKRQLAQSVYYPVNIRMVEQNHYKRWVNQTVCLNVSTPVIRTLEISHGVYTLFDPKESSLRFLNDSLTPINVAVSSIGLHFFVTNLHVNQTYCYQLQLEESARGRNSPNQASPVPIRAIHDVQGLVGMLLISHPDAIPMNKRRKHVTRTRFIRQISDPISLVDKICLDNGNCACAEITCNVQCNLCRSDKRDALKNQISRKGNFVLRVRVSNVTTQTYNNVNYTIIICKITDFKPKTAQENLPENLEQPIRIWLRTSCNFCDLTNDVYMILGRDDGWTRDGSTKYNYIMNSEDRIEANTKECSLLNSLVTLSDFN